MKTAVLALFVALVMGVMTFGVTETAYAHGKPAAGRGSDTTKLAKKNHLHRRHHHREKKSASSSSLRGFVIANQF